MSGMSRGQQGTVARSWIAGDAVTNEWTAGAAEAMTQISQLQQQAPNYGPDVGTANNYLVYLTPAPVSLAAFAGIPVRVLIANTNTGPSTLSINGLAATINYADGSAIVGGQISANCIAEFIYDTATSSFQLMSPADFRKRAGGAQSWTSPGTYSFTVPANVYFLDDIRVWGAGGGGGGGAPGTDAAGGGAGGGYSEGPLAVTPGQVITVSVAGGGSGGTPGNDGSGGGTSSFGGLVATGGNGGFSAAAGGIGGGSFSVGSGSGGSLNMNGGQGLGGALQSGIYFGGAGGWAPFATGATIPIYTSNTGNFAGLGAGGGGGVSGGGGGNGGNGLVVVKWII
jgi:hypothetical protein